MPAGRGDSRRLSWRKLAALYLGLLAVSMGVAHWRARDAGSAEAHLTRSGRRTFVAHAVTDGQRGERSVQVAYRDAWGARDAAPSDDARSKTQPARDATILLLHGSPGDADSMASLARPLARHRTVVAPDLPGFGYSARDVPDYSVAAHADYALALLDELGLDAVHVVGFSMGSGVAIHLADRIPERIRSVTLVAGIGVQETELFGSYLLNHAVHGLQLAAVRALNWLVPHFGALDDFAMGVPYARNFYDTDQRPLREMLGRCEQPMLIVHGEHDFLVPAETAREHHRIVPQSELALFDTSHFLIWTQAERVAELIEDFLGRVERGAAPTRSRASQERVAEARRPYDPRSAPRFEGPALLLAFLLLAAATLVSEDLTCIGAGLLVAQGRMGFASATLACFVGIFLGDLMLYVAGRALGRPVLEKPPLRWFVTHAGIERATHWFGARGARAIFLSRFLPGLRLPTYVAAGILRMRLSLFAFYFLLAGALWTPLLVGAAAFTGTRALGFLESFERWALPAFLGFAFALLAVERLVLPLFSFRGRRLLLGAWRRKLHFEFWPPIVFYLPVALYVAWLALRHKSLALVTAVNPAIPTGGFIGESKTQILAALRGADAWVAEYRTVSAASPAQEREALARGFMAERGLGFPVVLKPDVGQRGSGVQILRDPDALSRALAAMQVDCILQEYIGGPEFGVFYVRHPRAERGEIFSITEKRLPVVHGDGEHTLEELILRDERAVCAAATYFDRNARRLQQVPRAGQEVRLVELGTHCRGAIFLDGGALITPALEQRFEEISRTFEGFYFGRYDVRTTSAEELSAGRGFKILELNGLTSEATHIYDPKLTLVDAYRTLFRQWRLAYEIAHENRRRGAPATSLRALARAWRDYSKLQRSHRSDAL